MKKFIHILLFIFYSITCFSQNSGDIDKDGISDATDNCKYMYNPKQEDLDKSGIGDACEFSPILLRKNISFLEDTKIGYEELMSKFIQDSLKAYITWGDGTYKEFIEPTSDKIKILKSLKLSNVEFFKIPFIYKKEGVTITDTLSIYIIRYLSWTKNTGKIQNGYIPYYYETFSNGMTGIDNTKYQSGFFTPANQSSLLVQDIDNNGINDLIGQTTMIWYPSISDTSKNKEMPNIQRLGIPVYIKFDSSFNVTFYHENLRNPDVLWHQPDFYDQVDLNKDGKKEIINLGEHYHTDYFLGDQDPKVPKNILGKSIMKYLGLLENVDYNLQTAGKLNRYYTIENGRLVDKKDLYDYSNLKEIKSSELYITDQKFVSIFGSGYGDLDNDGDIDYVTSIQGLGGSYIDILLNDGNGKFTVNRIKPDTYGYDTRPEGHNILYDINGDGYLDYFFGGSFPIPNSNNREGFLGYVLNDKKGNFLIQSMTNLGNFGSKMIAPKYMYQTDLDNDKKNEIIVYRSTGLGSGGSGIQGEEFINDILIFSNKNGTLINDTDKFIDTLSRSKMYAQNSILYYEDIDGDKIKDMFIKYEIDSAIIKSYSPFTGYWEKNYNGFSYFQGSKDGKFKYTRLGKFVLQDGFSKWYNPSEFSGILSNNFQIGDIDNDGTAELIHQPNTGNNIIIFKLYDCIKPTISTSKLSICGNDSVSVKISNKDSYAKYTWYLNNDSVSKSTDSIFIKKEGFLKLKITDSLGCSKFSDSLFFKLYSLPITPSISRDTSNNLISNASIGNVWYKDGTALTDTTQKIKPGAAGSYTVKTTQNGCASALSNPYYFLVTDIINLSKDEYIKLAPNPFINQLNFDFVVKGYQRLNLEIFDLATGVKVASKQNLTAGISITLGHLSAGNYIIKVSSNDNKIVQQFKMVKL